MRQRPIYKVATCARGARVHYADLPVENVMEMAQTGKHGLAHHVHVKGIKAWRVTPRRLVTSAASGKVGEFQVYGAPVCQCLSPSANAQTNSGYHP